MMIAKICDKGKGNRKKLAILCGRFLFNLLDFLLFAQWFLFFILCFPLLCFKLFVSSRVFSILLISIFLCSSRTLRSRFDSLWGFFEEFIWFTRVFGN